jgi:hypothetical protein
MANSEERKPARQGESGVSWECVPFGLWLNQFMDVTKQLLNRRAQSSQRFECFVFALFASFCELFEFLIWVNTNKKGACMPIFRGTKERLAGPE